MDGVNVRVSDPAADTGAGADNCRLSVCCSPLAIAVVSKLQMSAGSGEENPVPDNVYVRGPTVSVPEWAVALAGANRIVKDADSPAAIVTALPRVVLNAAPLIVNGETVSACGNGFIIESVQDSCVPCGIRPKLMAALASGPVHGAATLKVGAGTTVARRMALTV